MKVLIGLLAYILLIFIILRLIISFIRKKKQPKVTKQKRKEVKPNTEISIQNIYSSETIKNTFNKEFILPDISIQRKIVQTLESINILQTTKCINTLIGRIEFILKIYEGLIIVSSKNTYTNNINIAVERYSSMYYNKPITEIQLLLITCPNSENLKLLIAECIVDCYAAFAEKQEEEISKLKTAKAKERRRENVINLGYKSKLLFDDYNIPDHAHRDMIENIRRRFYLYQRAD